MIEAWQQYGIVGILVAMLAIIAKYGYSFIKDQEKKYHELEKLHKEERVEWKETIEQITQEIIEEKKESNKVLREHTNIVAGLKSLLENRKP